MKTCYTCKVEKELTEFGKAKENKAGLRGQCKWCRNDKDKKYRDDHKEEIREIKKKWRQDNKEKIREEKKKYHQENKEKINDKSKKYYKENKEKINEKKKKYNSTKEAKEKRNKRERERKKTDPLYKLTGNIRSLIGWHIRNGGYSKTSKTADILGCDFEFFKAYIERKFEPWMTWDNRSEWHLDHIYPASKAKDEEHLIKLNHYTNFRPLKDTDNLSKGNKIEEHQTKLTL